MTIREDELAFAVAEAGSPPIDEARQVVQLSVPTACGRNYLDSMPLMLLDLNLLALGKLYSCFDLEVFIGERYVSE